MNKKKKAPLGRGKGKRIAKGNVKNRILQYLLIGEYNAQELSSLTGACDPRAHIRDLRYSLLMGRWLLLAGEILGMNISQRVMVWCLPILM